MLGFTVVVATVAMASGPAQVRTQTLTVAADSSLREFVAIAERHFESSNPQVDVKFVLASAGQLADEIRSGTGGYDVYLSSGPRPTTANASRLSLPRTFARNTLILITPKDAEEVRTLSDLAKAEKWTLPVPTDPMNAYVHQLLDRAAQAYGRGWHTLVTTHMRPEASDVRAVVREVAAQRTEAGFVYLSDFKAYPQVRSVSIPAGLNVTASYTASVVRSSRHSSLARSFVEYLYSARAQAELTKRGFLSPLTAPSELPVFFGGEVMRLFVKRLSALPQATLKIDAKVYRGASLVAMLKSAEGSRVRITGADGMSVDVALSSLRQEGAILVLMPDGNVQTILAGRAPSQWVRWVRRIEVL